MNLIKAMSPDNLFYILSRSTPKWTKKLKEVVCQLACAECNYLYYNDIIGEIGQTAIDSLIEYNVLHSRPFFPLAKDLNPAPTVSKTVITVESQIGLYAMKELSKQYS